MKRIWKIQCTSYEESQQQYGKNIVLGKKKNFDRTCKLFIHKSKNEKMLALKLHWIPLDIWVIYTLCSLLFEILVHKLSNWMIIMVA